MLYHLISDYEIIADLVILLNRRASTNGSLVMFVQAATY